MPKRRATISKDLQIKFWPPIRGSDKWEIDYDAKAIKIHMDTSLNDPDDVPKTLRALVTILSRQPTTKADKIRRLIDRLRSLVDAIECNSMEGESPNWWKWYTQIKDEVERVKGQ